MELLITSQMTAMQYDEDYTTNRIENEKASIRQRQENFMQLRDRAYDAYASQVDQMKGFPLVIADAQEIEEPIKNPFDGIGKFVYQQTSRINPLSMRERAQSDISQLRDDLNASLFALEKSVDTLAQDQLSRLDDLDVIYNTADAMLIASEGI
ncbi:MAG: hypothetical protein LUB61_00765, partial [Eggerthellaceae bacterium]|nr:hypothetical protein [Eggerthellaceae bacterium]